MADDEEVAPPPPPPPPAPPSVTTLPSGLTYSVIKKGSGGEKPIKGDLVAIRFKASIQGTGAIIDNIMDSPEPYYYRAGSGVVVPAVEEAVLMMRTGDVWQMVVPPELGFGSKGRSASPGKPRIPGTAVLDFTLEMVAVPGKDEELLDVTGGDI